MSTWKRSLVYYTSKPYNQSICLSKLSPTFAIAILACLCQQRRVWRLAMNLRKHFSHLVGSWIVFFARSSPYQEVVKCIFCSLSSVFCVTCGRALSCKKIGLSPHPHHFIHFVAENISPGRSNAHHYLENFSVSDCVTVLFHLAVLPNSWYKEPCRDSKGSYETAASLLLV